MKKIKVILNAIIFALVPTILAYLGKSYNILNYLKENEYIGNKVNINFIKEICLFLNIIATFLIVTLKGIKSNINEKNLTKQRDNLLKQCKEILTSALSSELDKEHLELNVRIFVKRKETLKEKFKKICRIDYPVEFIIKNITGFANDDVTSKLKFEVAPNPVGLVGRTFKDKCIYYDCDLENTNTSMYNLSHSQINKTNDLKFSLTCPIFKTKDEVVAILAIDSRQKIDISGKNEKIITNSVNNFSTQLYEYVPDLFKEI
ncbi:hypothetical protein [Clostridium ihumii]|uniref:hypothetical protein n=1 Tax=Clostridium ihumii TaxID=1470356 RepID=UPI0005900B2B|nr:hypothetical protein [Clostridium ihumii]